MGMGPITWACLMLTLHQGATQESYINSRSFEIPIRYKSSQADIRQLFLYVRENEGEWQVKQYAKPNQHGFIYRATHDGKYSFIVGTEDHKGNPTPPDPLRLKPEQIVIVDTEKPRIQVDARRQANGEVQVRWTIAEEYPDASTLRVDYRTAEMKPDADWRPLPVNPMSGQTSLSFPPDSNGEIRIRVRIKDKAENVGEGVAVVPPAGSASTAGADPVSFGTVATVRAGQNPTPGMLASRQTPRDPVVPPSTVTPVFGAPAPAPMSLTPPDDAASGGRPPTLTPPVAASGDRLASNPSQPMETPHGALTELKIVNKPDVKLEITVGKVGPSGLGGTDVYVTVNEGATWNRVPGELPVTLPPGADLRGAGPVHATVTVQLPGEGTVYGFIVAVKSKAGRGREPPKPGEPPQVRVELDSSAPKAELFGPMPDAKQRNALILSWNALDRNLSGNCVTLEWAEHKDGPWTIIGGGSLPNTVAPGLLPAGVSGAHVWQLPERMPSSVFLRLTVRDAAGNAAVAQTDKPVLIDLSVPETSVIGIAPASR